MYNYCYMTLTNATKNKMSDKKKHSRRRMNKKKKNWNSQRKIDRKVSRNYIQSFFLSAHKLNPYLFICFLFGSVCYPCCGFSYHVYPFYRWVHFSLLFVNVCDAVLHKNVRSSRANYFISISVTATNACPFKHSAEQIDASMSNIEYVGELREEEQE